jgi:hypothetical protein
MAAFSIARLLGDKFAGATLVAAPAAVIDMEALFWTRTTKLSIFEIAPSKSKTLNQHILVLLPLHSPLHFISRKSF